MAHIDEEVRDFLLKDEENAELINSNDFEKLYTKFRAAVKVVYKTGMLSQVLYNAGIDPLPYMTKIPSSFLYDAEGVTSVTIPKNIKSIGVFAFKNCKDLVEVRSEIPRLSVPVGAFEGCVNLKSPYSLDRCVNFEDRAFKGCKNLTSLTLSAAMSDIYSYGEECLKDCENLGYINYLGTKQEWVDGTAVRRRTYYLFKIGYINKFNPQVVIHCTDGDIEWVKLRIKNEETEDIIYDIECWKDMSTEKLLYSDGDELLSHPEFIEIIK